MAAPERLAARARGQAAERRAVWLLRLKGYRILARNFRPVKSAGLGEIDIVARRGRVLAFIEVKARVNETGAILSILPAQQQRIARAAETFIKLKPAYAQLPMRYDAMVLEAGRFWPKHLTDAWRP